MSQIKEVLEEYRAHLPLTLRQVFYRLVATRGYGKTELAYERLSENLNRARRAELIPFSSIRDDGITLETPYCFDGLDEAVENLAGHAAIYRRDRLEGQKRRIMVLCEGAGMVPQLRRVCEPYSIPVQSSGGFDSVTAKHALAQRLADQGDTVVLHLGDHDPSGVHVFANLAADVGAFLDRLGGDAEFIRHAVTSEQIEGLGLPTAPAKSTDRRSFEGVNGDSTSTVQAEAIPPDVLAAGLRSAIERHIDFGIYQQLVEVEQDERRRLVAAVEALELSD